MCCGTAQNSYRTIAGMRVVLADGTVLDTRDAASRAAFLERKQDFVRELDALARADARQRRPRLTHPAQVPPEEHHRLQPECAGRLRGSDRYPGAPDDRLRGHARVHQRNHLSHRPGICRQGECAHPVRRSRNRVPGGDRAQERAGCGGRARRSCGAALGGRHPGLAARHPRAGSRRGGVAGGNPRRKQRCARRSDSRRSTKRCRGFTPPSRSAFRPTRRNARGSGTCARACFPRWARCAKSAPP